MSPHDDESSSRVLQQLREATAAQHEGIERLLRLDSLDTRGRLVTVLQVFEAFLADWEPRMAHVLPAALRPWFARHCRGSWAAHDLHVLGAPTLAPLASPDIVLDSAAAALGSLYVIEGSALGGQVIARRLHERLGLTAETGARFFGGRGKDTARIWREYREHLRDGVDPQDASATADCRRAARHTFEALMRAFSGEAPSGRAEPSPFGLSPSTSSGRTDGGGANGGAPAGALCYARAHLPFAAAS